MIALPQSRLFADATLLEAEMLFFTERNVLTVLSSGLKTNARLSNPLLLPMMLCFQYLLSQDELRKELRRTQMALV